jgi:hypothetical protein
VRAEVLCNRTRREFAPTRQCHGQQQLVGEMRPDGCSRRQVTAGAIDSAFRHGFRGNALLTETGKYLGRTIVLNGDGECVPRTDIARKATDVKLLAWPLYTEMPRENEGLPTGTLGA